MTDPRDLDRVIESLSSTVEQERALRAVPPETRRSRVPLLLGIGLVLIASQIALRYYATSQSYGGPLVREPRTIRRTAPGGCRAEQLRTYAAVAAFIAAQGVPPPSLDALIGQGLERRPLDPETKQPLVYWTDGKRFTIGCPPPPAAR